MGIFSALLAKEAGVANDTLSLKEASMYLSMDEAKLSALAAERRIPCLEQNGSWVFSKKSIDKWRGQQRPS